MADSEKRNCEGLQEHNRETNALAKDCLKAAMLELARNRNYKDISVTELCRRAGVSRMAFYRNYRVINDVYFEIAEDLNMEIVRTIGSPFREKTDREWYVKAFCMIIEHRETMRLMLQENFQYQWMKTVNRIVTHDESFPAEQKYQRLIWCGGFENTVSYWLSNGMRESPEEMADYCIRYLPHLVR